MHLDSFRTPDWHNMNFSKSRHSFTALLLGLLMLCSAVAGATESIPHSVNVEASCQVHVSEGKSDGAPEERHSSECEQHQCCLPHSSCATLAHQPITLRPVPANEWHKPSPAHARSLVTQPPVPPPNRNGLI